MDRKVIISLLGHVFVKHESILIRKVAQVDGMVSGVRDVRVIIETSPSHIVSSWFAELVY